MSWELKIKAVVNGRVRKSEVLLLIDGVLRETARVDLMVPAERQKLAGLVATMVGEAQEQVLESINLDWFRVLEQHEQAEAAAEEARPPDKAEDVDAQTMRLLKEMPADVRAEAETRLQSPGLLAGIADDIATLGVAGERLLVETLYLLGTSRLLKNPLAARIKGPSSSGKSYLLEQVARLFPAEAVIHATQMTPQSLFHMRPGSLRHRWIVGGERSRKDNDDTAEATRALREMISAGRLSKLMPVKVGGEIVTRVIEQDGPIAFVESTTLESVFAEDENRCVALYTDERPEQTRLIINRVADRYAGVGDPQEVRRIVEVHHAMQRMLCRREVLIPYATSIGNLIPEQRVETRRAFPHLLGMVATSCLLHQYQREQDERGRLLANEDDYRIAVRLLQEPLRRSLGDGISEPASRFFLRIKKWFEAETFTTKAAQARESTSRSSVYGWIGELHKAGALQKLEEGRGSRAAVWRIAVDTLEEASEVLPAFDDVFG
jgi:hypothetical protein